MAEPKAKTLQQKLGFFDEDLKLPEHDEIIKWVDSNAEEIVYLVYPGLLQWNEKKVNELKKYCADCIQLNKKELETSINEKSKLLSNKIEKKKQYEAQFGRTSDDYYSRIIEEHKVEIDELDKDILKLKSSLENIDSFFNLNSLPERKRIIVKEKKWEYPVTSQVHSRTGYVSPKNIIGFIDLRISFLFSKLTITGIDFKTRKVIGNIEWNQTYNFIDLNDGYVSTDDFLFLNVEVKTRIDSLGVLFRQLNTYKEFCKEDYLIVCPDDSEKQFIMDQGFKFIQYLPFKFKK